MGCINSKKIKSANLSRNISISDLSEKQINKNNLLNADRTVPEYAIKDYKTWAKVVYVYDGDTCHIVINYRDELVKLKCRIYGMDTPEMRGGSKIESLYAKRAKDKLITLTENRLLWVNVLNNDDKYGRYLTKLYLDREEKLDISKIMIENGLAYKYDGGKKLKFEEWYKKI